MALSWWISPQTSTVVDGIITALNPRVGSWALNGDGANATVATVPNGIDVFVLNGMNDYRDSVPPADSSSAQGSFVWVMAASPELSALPYDATLFSAEIGGGWVSLDAFGPNNTDGYANGNLLRAQPPGFTQLVFEVWLGSPLLDGQWHVWQLDWDATTGMIAAWCDGQQVGVEIYTPWSFNSGGTIAITAQTYANQAQSDPDRATWLVAAEMYNAVEPGGGLYSAFQGTLDFLQPRAGGGSGEPEPIVLTWSTPADGGGDITGWKVRSLYMPLDGDQLSAEFDFDSSVQYLGFPGDWKGIVWISAVNQYGESLPKEVVI